MSFTQTLVVHIAKRVLSFKKKMNQRYNNGNIALRKEIVFKNKILMILPSLFLLLVR